MTYKMVSGLAAALAVCVLATPAAANGDGYYSRGYYSYKDAAPPSYMPPAGYESRVTVYQAAPAYYPPAPSVVYEQPVYGYAYPAYGYTYTYPAYGYAYPDCGCRGYRRRHRRCY
jgi:hypothetical protein